METCSRSRQNAPGCSVKNSCHKSLPTMRHQLGEELLISQMRSKEIRIISSNVCSARQLIKLCWKEMAAFTIEYRIGPDEAQGSCKRNSTLERSWSVTNAPSGGGGGNSLRLWSQQQPMRVNQLSCVGRWSVPDHKQLPGPCATPKTRPHGVPPAS